MTESKLRALASSLDELVWKADTATLPTWWAHAVGRLRVLYGVGRKLAQGKSASGP